MVSIEFFVNLDVNTVSMKLFTTSQIAELDQYTIVNEPIRSIDLMERASRKFAERIISKFCTIHRIAVFVGHGNNGGDALAVARMLISGHYVVDVYIPDFGKSPSECFTINLNRLKELADDSHMKIIYFNIFPTISDYHLIIDGLYGSGLTRPLTGFAADLVRHLNQSGVPIVSIDIPSGLMGEDNTNNDRTAIIRASYTYTFQFPKLSFFFKENEEFTGTWAVLPIGLHQEGIQEKKTCWNYIDAKTASGILKPRGRFSHKGTYGHGLLVAGSYGKMGAAILAAKGCLRSGVGLLTVHVPQTGSQIVQTVVPEAMVSIDQSAHLISDIPLNVPYKAIGIGPGLGQAQGPVRALRKLLEAHKAPIVIDADALNILSSNPEMVGLISENSILTPHPVEFDRFAGVAGSGFDRFQNAIKFAQSHHVVLILKGANTLIVFPDGNCWFNSTGNPGMATAGSGDVLTGILTGLLAQGYSPKETAILGVYLHGLSGDFALFDSSMESIIAGDLVENLGKAFNFLKNDPNFGKPEKKVQF